MTDKSEIVVTSTEIDDAAFDSMIFDIYGGTSSLASTNINATGPIDWSSIQINGGYTFNTNVPPPVLTYYNNGKEIVRLNNDGTVEWPNGIDISEGAEAFGKAMELGAELKAGITHGVKTRMRDDIFETLINIAKEKGSLTADDLTYFYESSKIIEKLKGKDY